MKTHRANVQPGKWLWAIAPGAVVAGIAGFVLIHWPASTAVAPQQGVFASIDKSKFLLRLSGSGTGAPGLMPELVRKWFAAVGASAVQETQSAASNGSKIPEWIIRAILNGNLVSVEVKEHGSPTAFRGMAEGDADIGITSPEFSSADVARLMSDFVRFALAENNVAKASFVPPPEERPELSSNPPVIALQSASPKPVNTEQGAKQDVPGVPASPVSAPPPPPTIAPEVATELTRALPATAAGGLEAASELTKRTPPVIAVVPEPESRALPPVASIVASLSPPPMASPLPIPPVAITSHDVTIADYPPLSIRRKEQGTVLIKYLVQEDGSVGDCAVTTPSGNPQMDDAACAMVKGRWKFRPATQEGRPVAEFLTAEVVFKLTALRKDEPGPTILESLSTFVSSLLAE